MMAEVPWIDLYDDNSCPIVDNINCSNFKGDKNLFLGPVPTYVSIFSSTLSCFGAASIILTYFLFKELRTTTRSVITFLAIADFTTALGYVVGGINYLLYYKKSDRSEECDTFQAICAIQSYITTWSQLSSFLWNCFLAFFLYLMIVYGKHKLANCLITLFHFVAWLLPITIALPLLVHGYLGFSPYAASNWCFIKDKQYQRGKQMQNTEFWVTLLAGKIPEISSYVFMIVFYTLTRCFIRMRLKHDTDSLFKESVKRIDHRLIVIPLVFVLLRIWGTIQFFFTYAISYHWQSGCILSSLHYIHISLGILEAIGDGGQGWANALIFVYLNSRTRSLIFVKLLSSLPILSCFCRCYRKKRERKLQDAFESSSISSIKYGSVSLPQVSGESMEIKGED